MPTDTPAGPLADRYEIGPVIGRGAMGEVRRAHDRRLGRDVAIKYLRADLAADDEVRARFEDEARAAARLAHPAIVTVFDSGEDDDGVPYLVMECLPGTTLAGELSVGRMDAGRVAAIASAMAGALAAAHEVGVVHRDVKPGNILLTEAGDVKLADFGIAKSTDGTDRTATDVIVGTPAYLAPERLAGAPATASSDVYSLGVVLYEALTGDKPFRGDTPVALAHAMHTTTPRPAAARFPRADRSLTTTIDRMLARDPTDRPASGGELEAMLSAGTAPTVATPVPPGDATVEIVAAPTAPLPVPPPEHVPAAFDGPQRGARRSATWRGVALACVAIILLGMAWIALDDRTGVEPPAGTTTVATGTGSGTDESGGLELPPALDGAIEELEEAIAP